MLAAKHFDPVVGIDIHLIQPPGPVPPLPIPHPFVGFLIDPADYVPIIGSTVQINGMHRAQAGTAGKCLPPHIPIGGVFVPPPPGNECEMFMGSATVEVDGDAQSYMSLPALSCQSIGMPTIPRLNPKKKTKPKCLMLPLSFVLPIPAGPPVMIGGPPTISISGLAMKAGLAALGKLAKALKKLQKSSKRWKALSDRIQAAVKKAMTKLGVPPSIQNKVSRAICSVTGHPVDIATGKVFTEAVDIELPGPLPLRWERVWYSTSVYVGPLGHGWHHCYDLALLEEEEAVAVRMADGRPVAFPALPIGGSHFDRTERLTLSRDADGYRLTEISGISYRFGQVTFDSPIQKLLAVTDRPGFRIEFRYDSYGRLEEITDSGGRRLPVRCDDSGRVIEIRGPHPDNANQTISLVCYDYDADGDLIAVRDALDQPMKFRYDKHLLVRETDRNGLSFYFDYDGPGHNARCVHTWGDGGIYNHRLDYDVELRRTKVTNSLGHTTTHFWNENGLVVKSIDPLGGVKETKLNQYHQILEMVNELEQVTTLVYDVRGNLLQQSYPDQATVCFTYTKDMVHTYQDANSSLWTCDYDDSGLMIARTDPAGKTTLFKYDARRLSSIIDPVGRTTSFAYSQSGELLAITDASGTQIKWRHDRIARVTEIIDANGNIQRRTWDSLNRLTHVVEPDGNYRTLRYDAMGNLTYYKDVHRELRLTYSGLGFLATRREAGTTISLEYSTEGDLSSVRKADGHVYTYHLDERRFVIAETGFDKRRVLFVRDDAGNIIRRERPSGLITEYRHDPCGRICHITHSDGSELKYKYSPDGALVEAENSSGTLRFDRDASGRVVKEVLNDLWVASEYDSRGLRTGIVSSLGTRQDITRDILGQVTALAYHRVDSSSSDVVWQTDILRDVNGLEIERRLPGGAVNTWTRDALGQPIRQRLMARNNDRTLEFTWGPNGRLAGVNDSINGPIQYEHDLRANLVRATHGQREILRIADAAGNLFRTRNCSDRTYGAAGQLLRAHTENGTITYNYDADGNTISKTSSAGTWHFTWDACGMLSAARSPGGDTTRFMYDAIGRRCGVVSDRHGRTCWLWDRMTAIASIHNRECALTAIVSDELSRPADTDDSGTTSSTVANPELTFHVYLPDTNDPAAIVSATSALSLITDHSGTVISAVDGNGAVQHEPAIDCWGHVHGGEESSAVRHRWPGQYSDAATGLLYNMARYYDPDSGAYLSQDPLGILAGLQPYGYVHDPSTWCDPLGLLPTISGTKDDGFGMSRYHWDGGGTASFEQKGSSVSVDYVKRGTVAPPGSAGQMLADSMKKAGISNPASLVGPNILQKGPNSNALIEKTLRDAAAAMGGTVTSVTHGIDCGKNNVRVEISYPKKCP